MLEVLREAVSPVNLPFTILLAFVTLYWLLVAVGLLDFESDAGVDVAHTDVHVDADAAHADAGHGHGNGADGATGALKSALQFLNFGDVPAMIVVTIMALSFWTCSMVANHYFNNGSWARAAVLLIPNIALTVAITKLATTPLKKFFVTLNQEFEQHKPVVGRTCTVITSEVTDRFGQAQIETSGAPLIINVRTYGDTVLAKGESALIIKEDKETNIFTVAKLTTATPQQETSIC